MVAFAPKKSTKRTDPSGAACKRMPEDSYQHRPEFTVAAWNHDQDLGIRVTWQDLTGRRFRQCLDTRNQPYTIPYEGWTIGPAFVADYQGCQYAAVRVAGWIRPIPIKWIIDIHSHAESDTEDV